MADDEERTVESHVHVGRAENSTVIGTQINISHERTVSWPIQIGVVPQLAGAYQPRTEPQRQLDRPVVAPNITRVLTGLGGNGKTQIAAEYARRRYDSGELDLQVWATASSRDSIVSAYAHAARAVDAADAGASIDEAAGTFRNWLERTDKRWLIVLDDLADPKDLTALWPAGASGDVVITSQRRDQTLSANGRIRIDVDLFAPDEAHAYLAAKLNPDQLVGSPELAEALGYLPLACAQAAAVLNESGETCAAYRDLFADQRQRLLDLLPPDALADDYGRETIATTRQLAVDAADRLSPVGRARPLLELAAYLDPNGIPVALFTDEAARQYVDAGTPPDERQIRRALGSLSRLSLIDLDALPDQATSVRVHGLVQRAVREAVEGDVAALAAADALLDIWPDDDHRPEYSLLSASLRANGFALIESAEVPLFSEEPSGHVLISRINVSLSRAGLLEESVAFCQLLVERSQAALGDGHPSVFAQRVALSRALMLDQQNDRAIEVLEQLLNDRKGVLRADLRDVLAATNNLGAAYMDAGRADEALRLLKQALRASEQRAGADSYPAMMGQSALAFFYLQIKRPDEALPFAERSVAIGMSQLGERDPATLRSRDALAKTYLAQKRFAEAIELSRRNLADHERELGADRLDTMLSRESLGVALAEDGQLDEAVTQLHRNEQDMSRLLNPDHPRTLHTRSLLATALFRSRRVKAAAKYMQSTLDGYERTLGLEHPLTKQARADLEFAQSLLAGEPPSPPA